MTDVGWGLSIHSCLLLPPLHRQRLRQEEGSTYLAHLGAIRSIYSEGRVLGVTEAKDGN